MYLKDFISYYRDICTCVATWVKRYSGIWQPKNTTKSQQKNKSHARDFIGREKYSGVTASAQVKNSRGLSRTQVHIALLRGGRVKFSRVKLSRVGTGEISNPELRLFTL